MQTALERIKADEQGGMLVYMAGHEGRGIGLWAKAATYLLQDLASAQKAFLAKQHIGNIVAIVQDLNKM